jgi:hypothetical protein
MPVPQIGFGCQTTSISEPRTIFPRMQPLSLVVPIKQAHSTRRIRFRRQRIECNHYKRAGEDAGYASDQLHHVRVLG